MYSLFFSETDAETKAETGSAFFYIDIFCTFNFFFMPHLGLGKVTVDELESGVPFCDILVYGWAGIDVTTNKVKSLNEAVDTDHGQGLYRKVTSLKAKHPKLKVLLGIGGDADANRDIYLQLLENPQAFAIFINSAYTLIKQYHFDGLDLAWQFKQNKPKRIRSGIGNIHWHIK